VAGWAHCKIGGYTGDTLGAACEIGETVPALLAGVP
jgi:cobalamin synthase